MIDSGATHPLRPTKSFKDETNMKEVEVSLADGRSVRLHMTAGGSMVTAESNVEPIVPMGMLIDVLGCEVAWKKGSLQVLHPCRGPLPVEDCGGCPQIPRKLALDLMQEMEEARSGVQAKRLDFEEDVQWMNRLVEAHPVLSKLPEWLKRSSGGRTWRLVINPPQSKAQKDAEERGLCSSLVLR